MFDISSVIVFKHKKLESVCPKCVHNLSIDFGHGFLYSEGMKYLTIPEASELAGVSEKTIRRACKAGKLQHKKKGKGKTAKILVSENSLDKLWTLSRQKSPEASTSDLKKPEGLEVFRDTIEVLKSQLAEKDKQIANLDSKLDQQQKLQLGTQQELAHIREELSNLLALQDSRMAGVSKQTTERTKAKKTKKKPRKYKPRQRDKRGRFKKKGFFEKIFNP